ncbi:MAG TPA: hypothetical protein VGQ79_05740 [Nitrospiraceae bacterium]|nr:hypothetical protein [Nitrospiraceae bacterium]
MTATKDIQFDSEDFIEKYLNKNSALDKKSALKAKIDESRRLLRMILDIKPTAMISLNY